MFRKIKKYLVAGIFLGLVGSSVLYYWIYSNNINPDAKTIEVFIKNSDNFDSLCQYLVVNDIIKNINSFRLVSKLMSYGNNNEIKSGKYVFFHGQSNKEIITILRSGKQTEVNLTFNNVRNIKQLSEKLSQNIELKSEEIYLALNSEEILSRYGFDKSNVMTMFIPNTYYVYWDMSVDDLLKRISKEYKTFWNEERLEKANLLGLSQTEVYILASIVDRETRVIDEKATIAGVYLNRLKNNILLQADPTVVYAVGDFSIRRVLNKHLEYDSPYNTYKYPGLPPGPIGMASNAGLKAVLNPEDHQYLFFCAKPDNSGRHNFAKNLTEHNKNARLFRNYLNKKGIRK